MSEEGNASQQRRRGFALVPLGDPGPSAPSTTPSIAPTAPTKKRKRQSNDEEEREERTSKRIIQSQQNYGLQSHQDIALKHVEALTMGAAEGKYGLTTLVDEYRGSAHPYASSVTHETVVEVWRSIRLQEPQRRFFPKVPWRRAQACPPTDKQPPIADPVLYLKPDSRTGGQITFQGMSKSILLQNGQRSPRCDCLSPRLSRWPTSPPISNSANISKTGQSSICIYRQIPAYPCYIRKRDHDVRRFETCKSTNRNR